jgi:hypothetical protein
MRRTLVSRTARWLKVCLTFDCGFSNGTVLRGYGSVTDCYLHTYVFSFYFVGCLLSTEIVSHTQ